LAIVNDKLIGHLQNRIVLTVPFFSQEECFFDCSSVSCTKEYDILVQDLPCLLDCFKEDEESCVSLLLNDVISKGVCNLTEPNGENLGPGIYEESDSCETVFNKPGYTINGGTCSNRTEDLLVERKCLKDIFEQQEFIINTILSLIFTSCRDNVGDVFFDFAKNNNILSRSNVPNLKKDNNLRLAPVQIILEDLNIQTKLQYNNTKHRYPWVCSLRSTGPSPQHRCAVNLLSVPPSPTVVVGAAHCTYLCKDGAREVPACCCSDSTDDCKATNSKCGNAPVVVEMAEADSIIICGEWETSQASMLGERYNIVLPIQDIIRHPDFDPAKGPIGGNDIVVFKVDDRNIQNNVANTLQLWPACLPYQNYKTPLSGIHTGWSEPPPFSFIQSQAPGYATIYGDFYKQWHYKMDIYDTCEDPTVSSF
jgi:hypothetical protein